MKRKLLAVLAILTIQVSAIAADVVFETYTNNKIQQVVTYSARLNSGVLSLVEKYVDGDGIEYENNHQIGNAKEVNIFTLEVGNKEYVLSKGIMLDDENLKISFASRTYKNGDTEYESFIVNLSKVDSDGTAIAQVGDPNNFQEVRLVRTYGKIKLAPFGVKLKEIKVFSDAEGTNEVGSQQF